MDIDIEDENKLRKIFATFLAIPSVSKANYTETETTIIVDCDWSVDDVPSGKKLTYKQIFTALYSGNESGSEVTVVQKTDPNLINAILTCTYHPNPYCFEDFEGPAATAGLSASVIRNNEKTIEDTLHIFSKSKLEKTFQLKDFNLHKNIYIGPSWGCTMAWSPDGTKLMYLAEKKTANQSSPYLIYGKKEKNNGLVDLCGSLDLQSNVNTTGPQGADEFEFRQSWGEQLTDAFQSVVVVLDIQSEEFKVLELPEEMFPCDLHWAGNSTIVGTGFINSDWRLGLIYCTNRESRIFQVGSDGQNFKYITEPGISAFCPRVRPDGKFLVWEERSVGGPHDNSRAIFGMELDTEGSKYKIYDARPANKIPLYANLPLNCWTLNGTTLMLTTPSEIGFVLLSFKITDEKVTVVPKVIKNVDKLLWIGVNYILFSRSSSVVSQSLHLMEVANLTNIFTVSSGLIPISQKTKRLVFDAFSPSTFYYGPAEAPQKSVPLIVFPHGGPHSVLSDEFSPEMAFFLELGYGVLKINYIGSIGGSSEPEDLCGKIGSIDLNHCQKLVRELLTLEPLIDQDKVVIFGGSHGGFLGAHLTSAFPEFYKAAALRNPVTDLTAILSESDITDWAYTEVGLPHDPNVYFPFVRNTTDGAKLIEWSPIQYAKNVKAATLLLLGTEDVRVPMSQGLAYYRALKHFNKIAEVRVYNDCHSLAKKVPCRFDAIVQSVIWFKKHLKNPTMNE